VGFSSVVAIAVAGEAVQGDERLEAGDAAAGDDDPVGGQRPAVRS
jgi:hypothetical protein